ncbi:hypothetical protein B0O99DRAFT_693809 [Bisporella sp. PMI_857]|nr:hypothetical protein B0O99DRAFT_693809 [Bisporella sp. PMI_857]
MRAVLATILLAIGAQAVPATLSLVPRAECPALTFQVSNQPWVCCIYSYTYSDCCNLETPPANADTSYFRSCTQWVADGGYCATYKC